MRDAPILNQAAEPILLRYLPRMVAGFRKRALLLRKLEKQRRKAG